ncbi:MULTISPECIES: EAL domain-containing protein [Pseudoalteromonas]|uniref:Diguanylate phosphodiesterase n=1 Tax=Pseudoalteromonas fuliginea TaxID=1872678 RepID=A0ABD3YCQ3_9GAMM|nr:MULTISPECIES: EAL domain-containing protein [Pseudoalteromonas]ALQ08573.1 diguanylate phosphodiesterase [Pseudoalteromonas sp. Bsw20308]KDC52758.1 diguanylate phosphodiesterase [Pseudoalteromonas fuliginea]KDC56084.1 diguanylate phosphodiesterase [Pseudoalteromonas sp. S3431]KJZ28968.1 diguanylate phosphodiesterase [Pseudoalteromonas fuliginea]
MSNKVDTNEALEIKTEQLSIINQFSSSLLQLDTLEELLEYVTTQVVNRLGFVDCVIYLADDSASILNQVASMGIPHQRYKYRAQRKVIQFSEGISGFVARTGEAVMLGDVSTDSRYIADERPAQSELCVPLIYKEQILGVIDCEHPIKNYFTNAHLEILTTVAHLLSAKINQVNTVNNLQQTVEQLNNAQKLENSLLQIANLTYKASDLDTFFESLHAIINSLLRADNFFIALYDKQVDILDIVYIVEEGIQTSTHQKFSKEQLKDTASYYLLQKDQPLLFTKKDYKQQIADGHFKMIGRQSESWLGVPFKANERISGVIVVQSYDKSLHYSEHDSSLLTYVSRQISMAIDRQLARQELEHRALHDELTGLANRSLLIERAKHAILRLTRAKKGTSHALLYLDFDRFKSINDSLGHEVGDHFLIRICELIKATVRNTDTFARLGGDEFAIFMENITHRNQVNEALKRIQTVLSKPIDVDGHLLQASTSIGIAYSDNINDKAYILLQQADAAMYEAKSTGRGQVKFFNNTMRKKLKTHADIENDLQHGIEHNEFELYFQPIFTIAESEVIGFEALVRWHHPKKGFVSPNDFIPIAETTGQIINLDLHLLDLAAQQISDWHQQGHRFLKITVNVSSRHFASLDFVAQIHAIYNKYQLPLGSLCLEITESGLIENLDLATQIIEGLSPLKVKLCLDDFGTGYSALGYLHQLPIHVLKIDKSFIDHLQDSTNPLVEAILSLAQSLKFAVVAEGIETVEQLTILQSTQCDFGQGFLKSKPVSANEAILLINNPL